MDSINAYLRNKTCTVKALLAVKEGFSSEIFSSVSEFCGTHICEYLHYVSLGNDITFISCRVHSFTLHFYYYTGTSD